MIGYFKIVAATLALSFFSPAAANSDDVLSTVLDQSDGTRTLVHEVEIDAPIEWVWWTLSTEEGWKTWGPRFAYFDLRHGGSIETGYHEDSERNDPRNIKHRIIAFVPERMLVIQVEHAPEGGPVDVETIRDVWGVYELQEIGEERTRLRISGVGYGSDDASSQVLKFFESGNVYSINLMRRNLAARIEKNTAE